MEKNPPPHYVEALKARGFELKELVGSGAYGSVYRANHHRLGRDVAVKFFDGKSMNNSKNRQRFEREAMLLAKVQHPSIPYVITSGKVTIPKSDPVPYSVMQYIPGLTLEEYLAQQKGPVPIEFAAHLMRNLLSALSCVHKNKVIHRDIKPSNIILNEYGLYLIDFSIGFCNLDLKGLTRATSMGERVGTADYASPEQLQDSSNVTSQSDIFSTGRVLCEVLGANRRMTAERVDIELSSISSSLRSVLRRALAIDLSSRYLTADDFLSAFNGAVDVHGASLEEAVVLCPNTKCHAARWSPGGQGPYYRGPKVCDAIRERHCSACGAEYLRACKACHAPLPKNINELVVKTSKGGQDPRFAFCSACGELLFETPICRSCKSYLQMEDMGKDTSIGCLKCNKPKPEPRIYGRSARQTGQSSFVGPSPYSDEDIPF